MIIQETRTKLRKNFLGTRDFTFLASEPMVEAEAETLKSFLEDRENPENKCTFRADFEARLINGEPGAKVR